MNLKSTFFSIAFLICALSFSQSGINYKAVIKDDNGNIIANDLIVVQFTIFIETGAIVYQESHTPTTDSNGVIIVNIGEGTIISGVYDAIDWASYAHFLRVHINSGSGLVDLGISEFKSVPYAKVAENVKGLEAIDEGNGMGWRLVGKDSEHYGNLGDNAIDLSESQVVSGTHGATGDFSVAKGINTIASGLASIASGIASNASGDLSFAMGSGTTASGNYSIAFGQSSIASGNYSTVFGLSNEASGNFSTALGYNTRTPIDYSTVVGQFNVGTPHIVTEDLDAIFEIGNGTSDSNRSNALSVLKNGTHIIRSNSRGIEVLSEGTGVYVFNPGQNGLDVLNAEVYGANISGESAGLLSTSSNSNNPDIILGGEDGILSTTNSSSADLYFRSNDNVEIGLDNNNDEIGSFIIRHGNGAALFSMYETGNLDLAGDMVMTGSLTIGNETIEDGGNDILTFSSSLVPTVDGDDRLGGPNRRWQDVYAVNGAIQTSDRRSKTNITNLNYGLAEVLQMKPVSFNWKNKNNPDAKLGLIAQDLQVLIPEVVHSHIWEKDEITGVLTKKELDRLGVYYSDLVPVLIKAIQEQQKIIESEKSINARQSDQLETLLSRIEQLESKSSN